MGANTEVIILRTTKPVKILKWKVKEGTVLSVGRVILLYGSNTCKEQLKLKAAHGGTVRKLLVREDDIVHPGEGLLKMEPCTHPTVMKDMCAECGADLRQEDQQLLNASVPMVHSIPELKVSQEQAQIIGKADEERLLKERKLVLLVDLDQTLIHTTNDNIPPNLKDVYHFQLHGTSSPWYHTRLRPGTHKFLKEISYLYELHICTFGSRNYAHMIAMFLDHDGQYFSHRILSRDECFSPHSKTANLKSLFPCGDNMVCIIDDREDVWNNAPNLIHVKPYHFFQHTGDINAPPGLAKQENDDKEGYDFSRMGSPENKLLSEQNGSEVQVNNTTGEINEAEERDEEEIVQIEELNELEKEQDIIVDENKRAEEREENEETRDGSEMKDQETNDLKEVEGSTKEPSEESQESSEHESGDKEEESEGCSVDIASDLALSNDRTDSEVCENGDAAVKKEGVEESNSGEVTKLGDSETEKSENGTDVVQDKKTGNKSDVSDKTNMADASDMGQKSKGEDDLVEVEDGDDYLLYLEEILRTIHRAFYQLYDQLDGEVPDLKTVVPYVRRKVLAGTSLVLSGLVPTHVPLQKSRPYLVAKSLGATVTAEITPQTTHLVAVRPGTAKVNSARRIKGLLMVTSDWLWSCAERWERVDERLFPLGRKVSVKRHPPPHCGSPELLSSQPLPAVRQRTPSGRFMDTINPLMSFSPEDIANMDREVEDIFNESESENERERPTKQLTSIPEEDSSSSSSSADSLAGEHPHGWGKLTTAARKRGTGTESDEEDMPSAKFRRGEALPSDLDLGEEEDSVGSNDPPDEVDDGDWNMMGAELEREFLSGNQE
uniref:RNA polymerase II subunit A C-terminal domain phosphatase n=1 Tax=Timema bartmani TaxID=61472 RepID=A0A7R9F8F5_9NEOP|nr:unnamed protein product [Timema bartmani]